jgi:membrane protease YdiL (CAAX protease family)
MPHDALAPLGGYLDWATRGKSALWRYALALVVIYALWILLPAVMLIPAIALFKVAPDSNLLKEYSFVPGFIVLPLVVRLVLKRPAWSIAFPQWPPRLADYGWGIVLGLAITVVGAIVAAPILSYQYEGFGGLARAGLLSIGATIVGFAIQTAFEEMLFRGFIAQFTRSIINFMPLVIAVQALIFGAMHLGNVKAWGGNLWGIAPYVMVALVWGWVAWRTGSLLVSAALHFVNNAGGSLLVGTRGDIIQSVAPLMIDTPTISQTVVVTVINIVLTVIAVEAYVRWRSRRRISAHEAASSAASHS